MAEEEEARLESLESLSLCVLTRLLLLQVPDLDLSLTKKKKKARDHTSSLLRPAKALLGGEAWSTYALLLQH